MVRWKLDVKVAEPEDPQFRAVFDNALDAMLIADDHAHYVDANPAACALLGVDRPRVLKMSVFDVTPPDQHAAAREAWRAFLEAGEMRGRFDVVRADGEVRETEFAAKAHILPGRHLSVLRDMTPLRKGERALDTTRHQLAQSEKLAALGVLVSGVAHEIRTPLTFVANNLFLLQKELEGVVDEQGVDPSLLERTRPFFRDAMVGVDRVNHLVLELRRFARANPGSRTRVGLDHAVAGAVALFRATSRAQVTIDASLEPTPPVLIDVPQLQQVVLNLLDNAADAQPKDARVHVATTAGAEGATLVVRDAGAGIPPEIQRRIFEGFFTTKAHGTGLGLSIVKRIVESHGGRVSLLSHEGEGTTFTVTLPYAPPATRPAAGQG